MLRVGHDSKHGASGRFVKRVVIVLSGHTTDIGLQTRNMVTLVRRHLSSHDLSTRKDYSGRRDEQFATKDGSQAKNGGM